MVEVKNVNEAFDALEAAFHELADIEDKHEELNCLLSEYVPESRQAKDIKDRIYDLRPKLVDAQRKYRLAAMKVDRTRMLIEVESLKKNKS
jgi:hypothetical protein